MGERKTVRADNPLWGTSGLKPASGLHLRKDVLGPGAMRALLPFLACLMLVITSLTSVAHAAEAPQGEVTALELAAWHSPGDADEVPADPDKDAPHHHSICHGHDLAAPVRALAALAVRREVRALNPAAAPVLTASASDTPLRPPIA